MRDEYFISVGGKGVMYTLRHVYDEVVYYGYESVIVTRNYHHSTLSQNLENAKKKAKEILGYVPEIVHHPDSKRAEFRNAQCEVGVYFGKYHGCNVYEIFLKDRNYAEWLRGTARDKHICNALNALFALIQAEIDAEKRAKEEEKRIRAERIAAEKARSQYVGKVCDKMTLTVAFENEFSFKYEDKFSYGRERTMYINKFRTEDGNVLIWKTASCSFSYAHNAEKGEKVKIKFTVKGYNEYKGEKQTLIQRVKVIEEV
jgi:hypothetical protein